MSEQVDNIIYYLKEGWWVMLLIIFLMIYGIISRMNVEHISRTVQTDKLCANAPQLAAEHMQKLDVDWMNKLDSVKKDDWEFWKIKTEIQCNLDSCSFWENISFKEKSKTLLYIWKSEVEMADKSKEDVGVICYLQNGWRFGSRWMKIHDASWEYGPKFLTDVEAWSHFSDEAVPFLE